MRGAYFRQTWPVAALLGTGTALVAATTGTIELALIASAMLVSIALQALPLRPVWSSRLSLGVGAVLAVLAWGGLSHSNTAFIATLIGIVGWLKLSERDSERDRFAAALIALWLIAFGLMKMGPNLGMAGLAVTALLLIAALSKRPMFAVKDRFKRLFKMAAATLACTAALFVFTPRFQGNLGLLAFAFDLPFIVETPNEVTREQPTDSMSLDDLNQTGDGDMRVLVAKFYKGSGTFENGTPPLGDLYWRGPVLWTYEAGTWQARPGWDKRGTRLRTKLRGNTYKSEVFETGNRAVYDLTVFPHRSEWLYALDLPSYASPSTYITRDWQLMNMNPVREVLHMAQMSFVEFRAGPVLDDETRALSLSLPQSEPRIQALGRQLRKDHGNDPVKLAHRAMALFDEGFDYDRATPLMDGTDPIDRFMFDTKQGFGMQFASAYALLMRAAGVPSRVVAGYRGGVKMGLVDKVLVLQRDAHAWTEIWLQDYGWVRMDAAARTMSDQRGSGGDGWGLFGAVDQTRLQDDQPAQTEASDDDDYDEDEDDDSAPKARSTKRQEASGPLHESAYDGHWLNSFNANFQAKMLRFTGLQSSWGSLILLGVFTVVGVAFVLAAVMIALRWLAWRKMPVKRRIALTYLGELASMSGLKRLPYEGIAQYVHRASQAGALDDGQKQAIAETSVWVRSVLHGDKLLPLVADWACFPRTERLINKFLTKSV